MANELAWTDGEIVRSFKDAADPVKQISVLADLNACQPIRIREILHSAGVEIPRKKKGQKEKEREKLEAGYAKGCTIMLVDGGAHYTMKQAARRHGVSVSYIVRRMRDTGVCDVDGTVYQIKKYKG